MTCSRLRAEEEQRRLQEARERQERAAQQAQEERGRQEEERRSREDEERRQKEQRWKDMQDQLDKEVSVQPFYPRWTPPAVKLLLRRRSEGNNAGKNRLFQREEAFLRAQREAERKRQERELLHLQEEQERLQRKKVPRLHPSGCSSVSTPVESFITRVFFGFLSPRESRRS